MPLPIKQYKHMFKDVKFLATTAQPSYREVSHWIDLLEDPTGGTIKVWNGTGWKKISGEGDSDTGLVIGDTTGTAYDGGKGKELEDTVADMEKNLDNGKLFKFDTYDLRDKQNSFLIQFLLMLEGSYGSVNEPVILQYGHNYDLNTNTNIPIEEQISSVVTVATRSLDISSYTAEFILYSNIYYSKANNKDQFIKITTSFNFTNEEDIQAEFQVEEVPVDLNGTISLDSFYVFPEDKLVEGAVLTEDEYSNLQKAVNGQKIAWFGNNFMFLSKSDDTDTIYFGVNTSFINREHIASDDYYSHVFIYATGNIDGQRTVHINDEYNKTGSLCYVYGQDRDITFIPSTIFKQGLTELQEALNLADIPMFIDYFEDGDNSLKISNLTSKDSNAILSIDDISTSNDAINLKVQTRYLTESESSLNVATTINKTIDLKLSGDGTKFLSDDGTYKEIDLSSKQDALISGTNIKTINGNSLLGEGNIEIQGGGEGIADAPSDGKKYVRQNANWVEETTVDTSNFATTAQLANKVDTSTYTADKATFATKAELDNKANTSDLSNYLTTTDAESNYAKKSEMPSLEGYLQTSTADEKYATKTELSGKADTSALTLKQDTLVSGTNIKTINNQSLLGNGNIDISAEDSKVYLFELDKYITVNISGQKFTGTIDDGDYDALTDAIRNDKLILGKMVQGAYIPGYTPLQMFIVDDKLYLKGEHVLGPICLEIDTTTKTYQGYSYSERVETNDSSTVTVIPLPDELIYIQSGTSTLTQINVGSLYNFRLIITTDDQSVTLSIHELKGLIGATFTGSRIILEANSEYEIDVKDDVAVVAKINKPQAQ